MTNSLSVTDAGIRAEFERLVVLEGRERAERLTCNLYGTVALGTRGRTRAEIHNIVSESKVKRPKKAKAETKADSKTEVVETKADETEVEIEEVPPSKEYSDLDYFQAAGLYEPSESQLKRLREALDNLDLRTTDEEIIEIAEAIFLGRSIPALPLPEGTSYPTEADAETIKVDSEEEVIPLPVPLPTLMELEARVTETWQQAKESNWQFAVALCAIHDSKLFPDSASVGGWERYTKGRWGLGRAQSFNLVAWVHHEIKMKLEPPPETPPVETSVESTKYTTPTTEELTVKAPETKTPPAIPVYSSEIASRAARSKPRPPKPPKPAPKPAPKPRKPVVDDFDMSQLGDPNDWGTMGSTLVKLHLTEMEFKVLNKGLNPATPDPEVAVCGHKLLLSYRKRYSAVNPSGLG